METSKIISSEVSLVLDLPPSCIQFCPSHPKFFVVGTYNLQKDDNEDQDVESSEEHAASAAKIPQSRNGSLIIFKLKGKELTHIQTFSQPSAILDLRFHPAPGKQDMLAVVSSTGTLAIFKLDPKQDPASPLKHLATSRCEDLGEDVLFLQCNWHPVVQNLIGVTTSTGAARLLRLDDAYCIKEPSTDLDIPNSLEAWCVAFSPTSEGNKNQVTAYCGGDDSMLRYISCEWDGNNAESPCRVPYSPITIKGTHEAGVTAILPLSLLVGDKGRVVVTGSYDDHLRVFVIHDLHETYGMKRVKVVLDENLGGGVWRLDLVDIRQNKGTTTIRILASCMHAGARLIKITTRDGQHWACEVLSRFEEHKSMNYGSDFVRPLAGDGLQCVSTSFYDKSLCLWEYKP